MEWLGQVPAHWTLPPLASRYEIELGKMLDEKRITGNHLVPYLRNVDVQWDRINVDDLPQMDVPSQEYERYLLRSGDLLVCEGGEVGRAAIWTGGIAECAFQKALHRVRPHDSTQDPRYLFYTLRFAVDHGVFEANGNPNTILHLTGQQLRAYRFPNPPSAEQHKIATFLDRDIAKIDALVAEQERLIELLKEKRQAVISHAVTKGLNPDAPMKDSGVDWLGPVPEAWTVTPLRYLVHSVGQGWSPQCESYAADLDSEYGVLKVGAVNAGVFDPSENKKLPPELEPPADLAIRAGDLMISRANTRELVGSAAVADADYPRLLLCDKLYRLRFRRSSQLPKFIARYLATPAIRQQIELGASGASASMLNISQSVILDLPVPVPPEDEMMTVLEFCAQAARQTSELIAQAKGAVDLLLERRAALITAAVTGQIDVRGLDLTEAA